MMAVVYKAFSEYKVIFLENNVRINVLIPLTAF